MKVAVLANADSVHTLKWVESLCNENIEIVLISLSRYNTSVYRDLKNFKGFSLNFDNKLNAVDSKFSKLKYLTVVGKIRKILKSEKPDILHAHYASSYGLVGALCRFHPYIISVWGSDVYEFPTSSAVARKMLKYALSKADLVLSTSHAMAEETKIYCDKTIRVTPFGIDLNKFRKDPRKTLFNADEFVIGTIKTFEKVYGIEFLIRAFSILQKNHPERKLKLMLTGKGSCETEYKTLVKELDMDGHVLFTGYVNQDKITEYYNNIDVFVVPSVQESFGVSVLEASACEIPVIASDTGGLPEVVENERTGFLVPVKDSEAIVSALEKLIADKNLRMEMGKQGRKLVETKYDWKKSVSDMVDSYMGILTDRKK